MTEAVKVAEFKTLVNALIGHDVTLINKLIAEAWECPRQYVSNTTEHYRHKLHSNKCQALSILK